MTDKNEFAKIEQALREERPAPRGLLLDHLVNEVRFAPAEPRRSAWHWRLGLAATIVAILGFALVGGFGAAANAAKGASHRAGNVINDRHGDVREHEGGGQTGEDQGDDQGKDEVCDDHHRSRKLPHQAARLLVASHHGEYGHCPVP